MDKRKAPSYIGGIGTELEFNLQRFATVENPYNDELEEDLDISGFIEKKITIVDLSYYAENNIANYRTVTTIPQENINYLSSGLAASNCRNMFYYCRHLTSIPWNEFNIDTSKCTSMRYMFYHCEALTSLDLYSLDTSQATSMNAMFFNCDALTSLDISNFDTSKVTDMYSMFSVCESLRKIICPNGFDMSSCTSVDNMFTNCTSYNGDPLHFKNVPRDLDFSDIGGTKGIHYVIDSYKS